MKKSKLNLEKMTITSLQRSGMRSVIGGSGSCGTATLVPETFMCEEDEGGN